jgi:hypothetical protein
MVADKGQTCALSGVRLPRSRLVPLELVSGPASDQIRKEHPDLKSGALIDRNVVNRYRRKYVEELLRQEGGELTDLDQGRPKPGKWCPHFGTARLPKQTTELCRIRLGRIGIVRG